MRGGKLSPVGLPGSIKDRNLIQRKTETTERQGNTLLR